ncbi:hypothetical protein CbuD7D7780_01395 [Coxiella burnetii]|uniref:Hypothetical membrane spanning protein n=1 Tax=Coxiella burnetii (strain Dugway 5J108-111) TaxID=434922 RepID=A9KBZ6_COXBN|nr:hypothetical protein [Coxiella burnetii]ABS77577.2 hypothetical membrane spanning protein [Coxiella burnetii Dugway 5J108-111]OYK80969.1 hypothetical protein CbuD7E6568_01385 [Coxiella burnetii]OYK83057.1 hypothetical protein CbuD7D7780_01395 [Coxiella burnetii]
MLTDKKDAKREMEMPLIPISREYSIDYSKIKTNIEAGRIPTPSGLLRNLEGLYFTIAHTDVKIPVIRDEGVVVIRDSGIQGHWSMENITPQAYVSTVLSKNRTSPLSAEQIIPEIPDSVKHAISQFNYQDKEIAQRYVSRLAVLEAWRRVGHTPNRNFQKEIYSLGRLAATALHVFAEGILKPMGFPLWFIYGYQYIFGLLTLENMDKPVEYPWWLLLSTGAIAASCIAPWLVPLQFNYATRTMGPLSNDELRRRYWDPQALNLFLEEKYHFNVDFRNEAHRRLSSVAPPGDLLSSSSLFPLWRESPDKPANEEEKIRANQLCQFTQRTIFFGVYPTEIFDSLSLAAVFFCNQTLRFSPNLIERMGAFAGFSLIGLAGGYYIKATAAVVNSTYQAFMVDDAKKRFQSGRITETPFERSKAMRGALKHFPLLTWGLPLLFGSAHGLAVINSEMNLWIKFPLSLLVFIGGSWKTAQYDVENIRKEITGSTQNLYTTPTRSSWCKRLMRLVRTDYLKINQFWKVIGMDTVYATGLFYLAYASLRNFYTHLLLPLFTENGASLSSFFEPLGDPASPAGLVMAFLAAGVTLTQTHQCHTTAMRLFNQSGKPLLNENEEPVDLDPDRFSYGFSYGAIEP